MRRFAVYLGLAALLGWWVFGRSCGVDERQAIRVGEDRVVVTNLSDQPWRGVDVWLNQYYRAQARELAPGQRLEIPLRVFVAAYSRSFDPARERPKGITVSATSADGKQVALAWGTPAAR